MKNKGLNPLLDLKKILENSKQELDKKSQQEREFFACLDKRISNIEKYLAEKFGFEVVHLSFCDLDILLENSGDKEE